MTRSKRNMGLKALQNLGTQARDKTVEAVTQMQRAFEQRVSRAVSRLGIPSNKEVRALAREVSQLKANVEKLRRIRRVHSA